MSLLWQYKLGVGVANPLTDIAKFPFCAGHRTRLPELEFDLVRLKRATPTLLKGEIPVADGMWRWADSDEIWHRAPDTGRIWPKSFFGFISYREGNPIGDARQVWEPSRLQHLVALAIIVRTGSASEREQAMRIITAQLCSWVESNPALVGAHYVSAMECALRMISVCHALDMVRDHIRDDAPWRALLQIVGSHARFIEKRLSLHSSTGNHTVAEAAGLAYAGLLFPELGGSVSRLRTAVSILAEAARAQVLPDGGGVEQALAYHVFNIQLLSLVASLLQHRGQHVPAEISSAVDRGNRFLAAMGTDTGWLPQIGDGDGGHALSRYRRVIGDSDAGSARTHVFHNSGCTIAHVGTAPAVSLVFDHGPLGMAPAYGHGHADALSMLLRLGGEEVFVDPGTYTYTGDQQWRRYFRGTQAHNTVTVDGNDQAQQEGCFLWSKPYRARLIASEIEGNSCGRMVAEHDGYREIGVRHVRGIAWVRDQWLVVLDELSGDGVHELELRWHMAMPPKWRDTEIFDLHLPDGTMTVRCQGGAISSKCGGRTPITGWQSPSYGTIKPITTVRLYHRGPLPHIFTTLIRLPGSQPNEKGIEDALRWMKNRSR